VGDDLERVRSDEFVFGMPDVSMGHGAVRTTFSATLPMSRCDQPPRPCVPITIRSTIALAVIMTRFVIYELADGETLVAATEPAYWGHRQVEVPATALGTPLLGPAFPPGAPHRRQAL
jgi:hypothetical protein